MVDGCSRAAAAAAVASETCRVLRQSAPPPSVALHSGYFTLQKLCLVEVASLDYDSAFCRSSIHQETLELLPST